MENLNIWNTMPEIGGIFMTDILASLANVIMKNSRNYQLDYLIFEVDGFRWRKIRVDEEIQVVKALESLVYELHAAPFLVGYDEDETIEFCWILNTQEECDIVVYMI